jgi:hypothetical protein
MSFIQSGNAIPKKVLLAEKRDEMTFAYELRLLAVLQFFWQLIKGYQMQNDIKSGIYTLLALFLVISSLFYFRAYMSMMPFFIVVFGGMLLFIHYVSTGFVLTKNA